MVWAGCTTCIIALELVSFAITVWQLVFSQGVLFALGWLVLYYPLLSMFNEWWVDRRGLASVIL